MPTPIELGFTPDAPPDAILREARAAARNSGQRMPRGELSPFEKVAREEWRVAVALELPFEDAERLRDYVLQGMRLRFQRLLGESA